MSFSGATLVSSFVAFFSTTIDDFAVMLVFFSRANTMDNRNGAYMKVIFGQSLAFTIVVLISLIGMVLGVFIPAKYINLIGFIPFLVGVQKLYEVCTEKDEDGEAEGATGADGDAAKPPSPRPANALAKGVDAYKIVASDDVESGITDNGDMVEINLNVQNPLTAPLRGGESALELCDSDTVPPSSSLTGVRKHMELTTEGDEEAPDAASTAGGGSEIISNGGGEGSDKGEGEETEEVESNVLADAAKYMCASCMDPFVLEVMVFGLVCSSDNIAIYTSIFASVSPIQSSIVIGIFYLLLLSNIVVAVLLMRCKSVAECFEANSKYLVPLLLMGLGLFILSDSVLADVIDGKKV